MRKRNFKMACLMLAVVMVFAIVPVVAVDTVADHLGSVLANTEYAAGRLAVEDVEIILTRFVAEVGEKYDIEVTVGIDKSRAAPMCEYELISIMDAIYMDIKYTAAQNARVRAMTENMIQAEVAESNQVLYNERIGIGAVLEPALFQDFE